MTAVTPFVFEDEHVVRSIVQDGEPWFVGKDVCRALGVVDHHQALGRLPDDEMGRYNVPTHLGQREATVISEPGVYRLIMTSRVPAAERFKRWLFHDVLPTLRKTGRYAMPGADAPVGEMDRSDLRSWIALVSECRSTFGRPAAQRLWRKLPLPQIDVTGPEPRAERSAPDRRESPEEAWWRACVQDGRIFADRDGWPERVVCDDLFAAAWDAIPPSMRADSKAVSAALVGRAVIRMTPGLRRRRLGTVRKRYWVYLLPPLEECRAALAI